MRDMGLGRCCGLLDGGRCESNATHEVELMTEECWVIVPLCDRCDPQMASPLALPRWLTARQISLVK